MIDLRLGRWQDVLADIEVDSVITDPPYGDRTHQGARTSKVDGDDGISYTHWTVDDVLAFVSSWAPRTRRWIAALTSHDLIPAYEAAFKAVGWYSFAPLGVVLSGMGVRMMRDGPSNWTLHLMVGRPRLPQAMNSWRSTPGGYWGPTGDGGGGRGKPAWLERALVRDFSDPGFLVADPCAGWGGILLAAESAQRRAIGAEIDPEAHAQAIKNTAQNQMGLTL
jgi:hypothetical protein